MIISKTPVRISFFGGGTDYHSYYLRKKGAVIGTTIDKYIYLSINRLSAFFEHKIKISYSSPEKVNHLHEIKHPSIRECLQYKKLDEGLDIHVFADLPAKTGLGSSSAFTVGFLNALYKLQDSIACKKTLADEALLVEQQLIKEKVGSQDQVHAAYGGLNLIEFDKNGYQVTPLDIGEDKLSCFQDHLLLFYTGITRFADEILDEQIKNTQSCSKDLFLDKMLDMVYEAYDIFLKSDSQELVEQIGHLMHQSWSLKKKLSSKISNPHIDELYEKARNAGAYGGKLCGAGHGGFLLLMAPLEKHTEIRSALNELLEVDFKFDSLGSQIIYQ